MRAAAEAAAASPASFFGALFDLDGAISLLPLSALRLENDALCKENTRYRLGKPVPPA